MARVLNVSELVGELARSREGLRIVRVGSRARSLLAARFMIHHSAVFAGLFLGVIALGGCGGSVESGAPPIDDPTPSPGASPIPAAPAQPSNDEAPPPPPPLIGNSSMRADCTALASTKGRGSFTTSPGKISYGAMVDVTIVNADQTPSGGKMVFEIRFSSTPPAYAEARASNANDSFWGIWFERANANAAEEQPLTAGDYLSYGGYGGGSTCTDDGGHGGSSTFGHSPKVVRITKVDGVTVFGSFEHAGEHFTFEAPLVTPNRIPPSPGPWTCCK